MDMGMQDADSTYIACWLNFGEVTILAVAEILERRLLDLALSGDALNARIKLLLQPVGLKLPIPVKGPKDAETVGVFYGKGASLSRGKMGSGPDYVCLQVDLYSKWLIKKVMQSVGFRKGSTIDLLFIDWPGRSVILACRLNVTDRFLKVLDAAGHGGKGSRSLW